ncbi:MAG: aminotransferase class V-fold PLP-dependent enzyme [Tractidigestivibacter sp.]|jgi:cysteine desulfurase family protein|uniref:aminotransferase class V-fold PLP-dependent enzyme n=1 Tax=Tractidigestivibacter sp. TaxID=2847320 RepID=UPI003D91BC4E
MIYLDNAATTMKKPDCVVEAVARALTTMGNASRGAHSGSLAASRVDLACRQKAARLFGCWRPDHVCFASNSTEALNIALMGILNEGDHAISTDLEHNSVLRPLYRLQAERGLQVDFVPADRLGMIDYDDFERLIKPNTRLIVANHASNVTGNLVDVARIGKIAHEHDLIFVVDASQTAGCVPIDMQAMGIDVLCFTGHKGLYGPQGTGGLCVGKGVEIRPWKVGGTGVQSYSKAQPADYPTRLEAGTLNSHGLAGLSAAFDFVEDIGVTAISHHERILMQRFYEGVHNVDGVKVYGDITLEDGRERTAIVSINIRDYDSGAVSDALAEGYGIATRPGAHCAPRMHQALGTVDQGVVRFSFSYFNTAAEVDAAIAAVREIAG